MSNEHDMLTLREICIELQLPQDACVELVELGVIRPRGQQPDSWTFDYHMIAIIRRTARIRREMDLDWSAAGVMVNLLEERDRLQIELEALQQRLDRFLEK